MREHAFLDPLSIYVAFESLSDFAFPSLVALCTSRFPARVFRLVLGQTYRIAAVFAALSPFS